MMGACLCAEGKLGQEPAYSRASASSSGDSHFNESSEFTQNEVDNLILETLTVIRTKVDIEEDPPDSLIKLNTVAEREEGWLQLVKAFIHVIPVDEPLGPAVMSLFLDDCPLPTRETALKCVDFLDGLKESDIKEHRNLMIVIGCTAEKLAGPNSVALLTDQILEHIIGNLTEAKAPSIVLFSLIALEKFTQTSENKSKIRKRLSVMNNGEHPLMRLERYRHEEENLILRQIGFCAQWCLDNLLPVEGRKLSHTVVDQSNINIMLNYNDVSEYLKLGPDGLTARCDSSSFESVRGTGQANQGAWYYEALLLTGGVMQIGWATKRSKFLNYEGFGIGDDEFSQAYDGCRQLMWYNANNTDISSTLPQWEPGDIVGCYLNISEQYVMFYLNGQPLGPFKQLFSKVSGDFFPAASFMAFQQCEFNFGAKAFKFPPSESFSNLNKESYLAPEEKIIWPRPVKLKKLQRISLHENTCTICYDAIAHAKLVPCGHSGFCEKCASQLVDMHSCPICRSNIVTYNLVIASQSK
eukprot:TRINITY_DN1256_c0_g1_i3.p1 TRINITY_DN1256_c0_g1~~TRINITY_DN1256_c0_g1_i3.p1  ORF type:complete len:525 (+),score=95.06 TRINITY_DN1256_c0_g1_i3:1796-3370(+)